VYGAPYTGSYNHGKRLAEDVDGVAATRHHEPTTSALSFIHESIASFRSVRAVMWTVR